MAWRQGVILGNIVHFPMNPPSAPEGKTYWRMHGSKAERQVF
jgi:hypothetical protein